MEINHCMFPDNILYDTENFVWVDFDRDKQQVTIGITTILGHISGKINTINLKEAGIYVESGRSIGTVESLGYFNAVRTPISGRILEINQELISQPRLANVLPYTQGWFTKIETSNLEQEIKNLQTIENCHEKMAALILAHHINCFSAFPDYEMFEIGVECAATLSKLNQLFEKIAAGTVVHLVSDDTTSDLEMVRWSEQTGQKVLETRREGNLFHFIIRKTN
jgi:glycine cleavage system H lipoate-binding protein/TusA-related sulfurtransferase